MGYYKSEKIIKLALKVHIFQQNLVIFQQKYLPLSH